MSVRYCYFRTQIVFYRYIKYEYSKLEYSAVCVEDFDKLWKRNIEITKQNHTALNWTIPSRNTYTVPIFAHLCHWTWSKWSWANGTEHSEALLRVKYSANTCDIIDGISHTVDSTLTAKVMTNVYMLTNV